MLGSKKKAAAGGAYNFRVSDVVDVPLRGTMLRLRLVDGTPSMKDLAVGSTVVLRSPGGDERKVQVVAHARMSGWARQERLDRARELDLIVTPEGSQPGVQVPADIGWTVVGPQ
jgi:hypothetical protein